MKFNIMKRIDDILGVTAMKEQNRLDREMLEEMDGRKAKSKQIEIDTKNSVANAKIRNQELLDKRHVMLAEAARIIELERELKQPVIMKEIPGDKTLETVVAEMEKESQVPEKMNKAA